MLVTEQLTVAIDLVLFFNTMYVNGYLFVWNCLVTNILQNIFFCVQQLKYISTGLELEGG